MKVISIEWNIPLNTKITINLPSEIDLPDDISDFDDKFIAEWLFNIYGFYPKKFSYLGGFNDAK